LINFVLAFKNDFTSTPAMHEHFLASLRQHFAFSVLDFEVSSLKAMQFIMTQVKFQDLDPEQISFTEDLTNKLRQHTQRTIDAPLALMKYSIDKGLVSMASFAINYLRVDPNYSFSGSYMRTVLHEAVICSNVKMVRFLIDIGASPLKCDKGGWSAIHYCCCSNNLQILEVLMESKAHAVNFHVKDKQGRTPMHIACYFKRSKMMALMLAKCLSTEGLNTTAPYAEDHNGFSPLHYCALNGATDIALMLSNNHSACKINLLGRTSVHCASLTGHLDTLVAILGRTTMGSIIVDLPDNNGNTALHLALKSGHLHVAMTLVIDAGADTSLVKCFHNRSRPTATILVC
jgi:ankyrin repeat protein